jgi:hypothetical protein
MKTKIIIAVSALFLFLTSAALAQRTTPKTKPRPPVSGLNFRNTTYRNGWCDITFSLRNNTDQDLTKVKYRLVFYNKDREAIHYRDGVSGEIPAGLAVQQKLMLMNDGSVCATLNDGGSMNLTILSVE